MKIPKKIKVDDLLRHSAILFASAMVVHVSNMVFQMAVGRVLPKDEYALLAAFFGALAIIQRPLATLRPAVCYYGSLLAQEDRRGDVKRLLRKWLLLTGAPSVAGGLLMILFSVSIAGFFHLDRVAPVIIAGALLPALCWLPILTGASQGLQMFSWNSASAIMGALIRLALGAGFVWFLYPACGWAMLGHGLGIYTTAGVLFIGLWLALHGREPGSEPLPSMRFYLIQTFFIQAAFAVLMTADVVLVKHFLPDNTEFAYAATLGRMVVFLPGAICTAMFPKVSSKGTLTREQRSIFLRSFGYTAAFVGISVLGCAILPGLLARILFGISDASVYLRRMIGTMALVMGITALMNITIQFLLAQKRFKSCGMVICCAVAYLACAFIFHDSAWQIVAAAGVFSLVALLATGSSIARDMLKPPSPE